MGSASNSPSVFLEEFTRRVEFDDDDMGSGLLKRSADDVFKKMESASIFSNGPQELKKIRRRLKKLEERNIELEKKNSEFEKKVKKNDEILEKILEMHQEKENERLEHKTSAGNGIKRARSEESNSCFFCG